MSSVAEKPQFACIHNSWNSLTPLYQGFSFCRILAFETTDASCPMKRLVFQGDDQGDLSLKILKITDKAAFTALLDQHQIEWVDTKFADDQYIVGPDRYDDLYTPSSGEELCSDYECDTKEDLDPFETREMNLKAKTLNTIRKILLFLESAYLFPEEEFANLKRSVDAGNWLTAENLTEDDIQPCTQNRTDWLEPAGYTEKDLNFLSATINFCFDDQTDDETMSNIAAGLTDDLAL